MGSMPWSITDSNYRRFTWSSIDLPSVRYGPLLGDPEERNAVVVDRIGVL
jgi:hypothetical protein